MKLVYIMANGKIKKYKLPQKRIKVSIYLKVQQQLDECDLQYV